MQEIATQETEILKPSKWGWVETEIWTERMLTALDNGVKGGKWFSLWDKVITDRTLRIAWKQVRSNRGTAGIDKVSVARFESNAEQYLKEIAEELKTGRYKPMAVKRVNIPKGDGKTRPLGIPAVKDRIVQTAVVKVIDPIFENEFKDMSYGFRPKRGAKMALREVERLLKEGHTWVVDADIKGYFDNIPQEPLMKRVEKRIADGKVLNLIHQFLEQPVMEELRSYVPTQGTPQGAVLSPLLANIYLHSLDEVITQTHHMVRYADDFVILCKSEQEAQEALGKVRKWTQENGLELHPDKTKVGNCLEPGQGFEFLGYKFEGGRKFVRKKSMKKLRDAIRAKTKRVRGGSMSKIIEHLNPTLKGWFEYFKHADKYTFAEVDGFVRRRCRSILRRQTKRKGGTGRDYGDHVRWPNKYFAELGLFTLQRAHVLACQSR